MIAVSCAEKITMRSIDNDMYAKLLMRAVTGSLYPFETRLPHLVSKDNPFPLQAYDFEKRRYGLDWPVIGHTMVGWIRLENIYDCLQICESESIEGDFVEAGNGHSKAAERHSNDVNASEILKSEKPTCLKEVYSHPSRVS